ncbi:MAG: hypothetical protein IKX66_05210 [Clostridia bacterium]|nr:hypothetical protein [Clostridia bacterium]
MTKNTLRGGEGTAKLLFSGAFLWFVGIGGVGMAPLAKLAVLRGFAVAGEDRREEVRDAFADAGIAVNPEGQDLPEAVSAVIYTAAVSPDHPSLIMAQKRGVPLISRSDFLSYLMLDSPTRVTVAGSHGKTTVTAMLDRIFSHAGLSPTTVSGGTLTDGVTFRIGTGALFLVEACEYTDSFLSFSPTHALLLNLELDHVDYFPDFAALSRSAGKYLACAGTRILPPPLARLAGEGGTLTFSTSDEGADLFAKKIRATADGTAAKLLFRGDPAGDLFLPVPGLHNLENALAACLTAYSVGVPIKLSASALRDFFLPDRRLTLRGRWGGALWYDDYAHHPSEIEASLSALRPLCRGTLTVAFQSHTYTRTKADLSGFASALRLADRVLVLPIFPARETDDLGISNETLALAAGEKAAAVDGFSEAAERMKKAARPDDVMVVMGAGDAYKVFDYLGSSGLQP